MKFPKYKTGFTLVEIIVSIGLFTITILVGLGALVNLFDANRKSQTIFSAISNLNYTVENMTRTIRFSTIYHCEADANYSGSTSLPKDCGNGGNFLAINTGAQTVRYRFLNHRIERSDGASPYIPITGSDITISYAKFYVASSEPFSSVNLGRLTQAYVTIIIKGNSGSKPSSQTSFDIETTVSQKQLDL